MESAIRCMTAGRASPGGGCKAGSDQRVVSLHGVFADSGRPLPHPKAGWDQVPTPASFFSGLSSVAGPAAWGPPLAVQQPVTISSQRRCPMFQLTLLKDRAIFLTGGGTGLGEVPWRCISPNLARACFSFGRRKSPSRKRAKRFTATAAPPLMPHATSATTMPSIPP